MWPPWASVDFAQKRRYPEEALARAYAKESNYSWNIQSVCQNKSRFAWTVCWLIPCSQMSFPYKISFLRLTFRKIKWTECKKCRRNSEKLNFLLNILLWFRINYSRNWECFDQSCVNRPETVHGTLSFLYLSHLLYGICVKILNSLWNGVLHEELHNKQEYYWPTYTERDSCCVNYY